VRKEIKIDDLKGWLEFAFDEHKTNSSYSTQESYEAAGLALYNTIIHVDKIIELLNKLPQLTIK
jgi:hypothetical protein